MVKRNQKKFTEEFKKEAVRLSEQDGRSCNEVAADLGISKTSLYRWRCKYGIEAEALEAPEKESLEQEVERLRKRVRRLEEERTILKKAAAFFAKESE